MPTAIVTHVFNAPLSESWAVFDDFGAIHKNHPALKDSYLINGSQPTGLGAQRQCDFKDGKNYIREKVINYQKESALDVDIYDGTFPLRRAVAGFRFEPIGPNKTKVTMTMDFTPKFGAVGALMGPMMRKQFSKPMAQLLAAHAKAAENASRLSVAA